MAEDQAAGRPPAAGNTILALGAGEAGPEPAAAPGMGMGQGGGGPLQRPQQRPRGRRPRHLRHGRWSQRRRVIRVYPTISLMRWF